MQIDVTNGKRFTEYDALAAVASGEDVLLVRLADGTGVKRILSAPSRPSSTETWIRWKLRTRPA